MEYVVKLSMAYSKYKCPGEVSVGVFVSVVLMISDLELSSYLFCDLKDYYANKLPNPKEDKGYVVYNCFEGQRKPFVVSLSDNSSPTKGIINMLIYKDK